MSNIKKSEIDSYIGKKIGKWIIKEYISKGYKTYNTHCVKCVCSNCGYEIVLPLCNLIRKKNHVCKQCKHTKILKERVELKEKLKARREAKCIENLYKKTKLYKVWSGIVQRAKVYGLPIDSEWNNNFFSFHKWAYENGYDPNLPKNECVFTKVTKSLGYIPSNCKWCTWSEKMIYSERDYRNTKSKYAGVIARDKLYKSKWFARVNINNKQIFLKSYKTIEDAVNARNEYIVKNNLPHKTQEYKG